MAFFGGGWNDDKDEIDNDIGPLSHWLEDGWINEKEIEDIDPLERIQEDDSDY